MKTRSLPFKHYFLQDINPVVRFLILSDTIIMGSAGLLGPIFAFFISDFIQGGNEAVAGLAAGIYLFTKSVLQIPIAHLIDRIRGERDDFWIMFIFTLCIGLIPLLYLFINTPLQLQEKWSALESAINKYKNKAQAEKEKNGEVYW